MGKRCVYGFCNSSVTAKNKQANLSIGLFFIRFPSPKLELEKCKRWVAACCRKDFSVSNIKPWNYICSKHFHGFHGPTFANPDPIPLGELLSPELKQKLSPGQASETVAILNTATLATAQVQRIRRRKELCFDQVVASPVSPCLTSLVPPCGWAMELCQDCVIFTKNKNNYITIKCIFNNEFVISKQPCLYIFGVNYPSEKISTKPIYSNDDIIHFLKELDCYDLCPGNNDSDLVDLYLKAYLPFEHRGLQSYYRDVLNSVHSKKCSILVKLVKCRKRCKECTVYRTTLLFLRRKRAIPKNQVNKKAITGAKKYLNKRQATTKERATLQRKTQMFLKQQINQICKTKNNKNG